MLLYTPNVEKWAQANSNEGITYLIYLMVDKINTPFDNSNTGITLHRVRSEVVNYTEPTPYDMSVTLDRLMDPGDGFMDEIHDLRGAPFYADLIQLITMEDMADGKNAVGWSYGLTQIKGRHEDGFSVVNVNVLNPDLNSNDYLTSCHEFGHSFGLQHGLDQSTESSINETVLFPYAYGWRWREKINDYIYGNNYYCTVMSYPGAEYYEDGNPSIRIPYFSNPDIIQYGQPTGVADNADAARTLREMKHVIASYSDRLTTFPAMPTNVAVSTTQTDCAAIITWDAAPNATSYAVCVFTDSGLLSYTIDAAPTNTAMRIPCSEHIAPCQSYKFYVKAINACGDVNSITQTFTIDSADCIGTGLKDNNTAKEVQSTDCYSITGIKIDCNSNTPGVVFKRTTFTDGSTQVVKELR